MTLFNLSFNTAEKVIFDGQVISLIAPGSDGYLEILAHHSPIITSLQPGRVTITFENKDKSIYSISEGFLEVSDNTATLLVDSAENASEINREQAVHAVEKAEANLALETGEIDILRAKKALARAKNRVKIYDDFHAKP